MAQSSLSSGVLPAYHVRGRTLKASSAYQRQKVPYQLLPLRQGVDADKISPNGPPLPHRRRRYTSSGSVEDCRACTWYVCEAKSLSSGGDDT